ncbi:MAG: hypothetical protein FWG98_10410 [Candidatus Cloacimonetes bacterium]|nr:hypothetical protein [Candidatus Cloacimonadota bacterium]
MLKLTPTHKTFGTVSVLNGANHRLRERNAHTLKYVSNVLCKTTLINIISVFFRSSCVYYSLGAVSND